MKIFHASFWGLALSVIFISTKTYSQSQHLAAQEDQLVKLYSKMSFYYRNDVDSLELYSKKFQREFTTLVQKNPGTLNHPFKKLIDSNFCHIITSSDGNLRIYSWDTWTGGTMHFFNDIYQWRANDKVHTKVPVYEQGSAGSFCSAIFTVLIKNTPFYLAVNNGIYSTKDAMQSVSALGINGKLLEPVKLFKTKKEVLSSIIVPFDFFSVVGRPERPLQLITYDDKQKILYIPLVDAKDQVTKKNLLYQLKDRYLEYIGIETGKRNELEK